MNQEIDELKKYIGHFFLFMLLCFILLFIGLSISFYAVQQKIENIKCVQVQESK